jgi:N-glycosylase/DNA lyase
MNIDEKMLNINDESDLKKLMDVSIKILHKKAISFNVPIDELSWYYDPLSPKNLERYKHMYCIPNDINPKSKDFLFIRFVTSLFNSGYHNDMRFDKNNLEKVELFKELSKSTLYFNLEKFLDKYNSVNSLESDMLSRKNLSKLNSQRIKNNARSIFDIAIFLKEQNDIFNVNIDPFKQIKVFNMKTALYWDAIKESNLLDIAKPDTHIIDVLNSGFDLNIPKGQLADYKVIKSYFEKIAKANFMTVYQVDKILWLVCAIDKNAFYLHDTLNFKEQLLNQLSSI